MPYFNVNDEDHSFYGLGFKDKENNQFCNLDIQQENFYNLNEIKSCFNKNKEKLQIMNDNDTFNSSLNLVKYLTQILQTMKNGKEKEYTISIIMMNNSIENLTQQEAKDLFVELSKFPISFIIIDLRYSDSSFNLGFLSKLSNHNLLTHFI